MKQVKKDAKSAAESAHVELSEGTKKASQKLREEAQELAEEAEELSNSGGSGCADALHRIHRAVASLLGAAAARVSAAGSTVASSTTRAGSRALVELQNPVVVANVALGAGLAASLLRGYAKYHARYLKGKSDGAIIATVAGAGAFLALDVVLCSKYYSKFDKKKRL